jgi:ubiquinol-cytochrome c reductase cytochrome b subunit
VVFLIVFAVVMFFIPELGGYFLEYNNFIPADPLKTPTHIAPVWYFTPYYSILRATTEDFMWVLAAAVIALAALIIFSVRSTRVGGAVAAGAAVLIAGFFTLDPKVWGVVLMGVAVLIFFFLPWLDRSPVKSIRYKGNLYKVVLAIFVISFLVLGYFGTQPVTTYGTVIAQIGTLVYFAFFALMPWYSRMDKTKPEPDRLTR